MPRSAPHRKVGVLVVAAAAAICVAFLFAAQATVSRRHAVNTTLAEQHQVDQIICKRVNHIYTAIQKQIRITMVATPKITYYKTHKKDLRRVQALARAEFLAFAPQQCPKGG